MTCHEIQHELIKCCAQQTTKLVIEELDGSQFAILADESADVYQNEQLAVCMRYVDKKGRAIVRFLGITHVEDTTAMALKAAIDTNDELSKLPYQLTVYISHVRRDERFKNLKNLCELSVMLVSTKRYEQYYVVYKLLKLVLILPVATASVERVFSTMNYVKNKQRNKMGDEYLNNCLVTFIEREFFSQVKDDDIINQFQKGDRRVIF